MSDSRRVVWGTVGLGLAGLCHGLLRWSPQATVVVFAGGGVLAFVAEVIAIRTGLLVHHLGPTLFGVPLYALFGWTGSIYATVRLSLLVTTAPLAVLVAAVVATTTDFLIDHRGVAEGYWTYTDELPGPRYREVPWWNYAGWLLLTGLTSAAAVSML